LKKSKIVTSDEVKVQTFVLSDFIKDKVPRDTMAKVSKQELKSLAQTLGLTYDDSQIVFAKKLLSAYLQRK
jgi:hypothetical protein